MCFATTLVVFLNLILCCGRRAENALKRWQPKAGDKVKVLPYHKAVSSEQQRSNLLVRPAFFLFISAPAVSASPELRQELELRIGGRRRLHWSSSTQSSAKGPMEERGHLGSHCVLDSASVGLCFCGGRLLYESGLATQQPPRGLVNLQAP